MVKICINGTKIAFHFTMSEQERLAQHYDVTTNFMFWLLERGGSLSGLNMTSETVNAYNSEAGHFNKFRNDKAFWPKKRDMPMTSEKVMYMILEAGHVNSFRADHDYCPSSDSHLWPKRRVSSMNSEIITPVTHETGHAHDPRCGSRQWLQKRVMSITSEAGHV